MDNLKIKLRQFAKDRNWDQFHSPKNLSMALAGEVGELMEIFQWLKEEETLLDNINEKNLLRAKEELADIFIYIIRIADKLGIDLINEANKKIDLNSVKYPVELSKDNAVKYNRRDE
ncbi:nucleotide pyrophosphohydrolase [Ferruginibacter lapsinanis]|uniref:nucleotide pyrophosphohydrolase n=1 Tax=Ferruginibacter lapsinanis TaxID=563172 RepID=UPI001E5D41D1|nr:nucleotide pyrophosphohydrolase [Ferruginibacter lapsinanis]UEG48630.1 nucleotide pyrophosphohydrolase [Ferruginibacter lapsinanis]